MPVDQPSLAVLIKSTGKNVYLKRDDGQISGGATHEYVIAGTFGDIRPHGDAHHWRPRRRRERSAQFRRLDRLTSRHFDPLAVDPAIVGAKQARDHRADIVRQTNTAKRRHACKCRVVIGNVAHGAAKQIGLDCPGATVLAVMPRLPSSRAM